LGQKNFFEFFSIFKVVDRDIVQVNLPGKLAQVRYFLQAAQYFHKRRIYCLLDLMADLGGIQDIIMFLLEWLLLPIAAHSFYW